MPARRRQPPTPALESLSGAEHTVVLTELLRSHPDLRAEAEQIARRLLDVAVVEAVADELALALSAIPLEDLAVRSGRVRGRGYVQENEAAWELLEGVIEPFRVDLRRRVGLDMADAATAIVTGIVTGLYQTRDPEDGTVVGYAGPDAPIQLAEEVINQAARLGVALPPTRPATLNSRCGSPACSLATSSTPANAEIAARALPATIVKSRSAE
jgi:hypothetical protein